MNEDELEKLLHKVLDQRQELIGFPLNSAEARIEHRKDAEFVRSVRLKFEDMAKAIGTWILRAFVLGFLFVVGIGGRKLGIF